MIRPFIAAVPAVLLLLPALAQEKKAEPKYEMTTYHVGLLFRGPNWSAEATPEAQEIQKGHMENIRKMADTGKLIVAGPFRDGGNLRGMLIFSGATLDEVKAMTEADPAVKSGRLVIEIHPWFAAKGIRVDPPK